MCGRFALSATTDQVEKLLPELYSNRKIIPNYNIAPSQEVAVILNTKPKEINFAVWGLIPSWAKDEKIGQKMINARSETLMEKPSFKNLFIRKRCLIIADGFYEWKKDEIMNSKTPYFIKMKTGEPFTFAGLWDEWIDISNNDKVISTTIITTEPNELMQNIHNRMPAIILPNERNLWLSPEVQTNHLKSLFIPIPGELLEAYPVSGRVNSPMNNDATNIKEL
jgi:putative SOS response-associated peptidase YedK